MEKFNETIIRLIQDAQLKFCNVAEVFHEDKLTQLPIASLLKPPYHSRVIVESRLKPLIQSLTEYDFLGGIFVNPETKHVIDGWHRVGIWAKMGHTTIPCFELNCTYEQEAALHLKLNQQTAIFNTHEFGMELLQFNLVEDFGFTEADLKLTEKPVYQKPEKQSKTKEGYTRLVAEISVDAYEKLRDFKKNEKLKDMADAIEVLIEKYETYKDHERI